MYIRLFVASLLLGVCLGHDGEGNEVPIQERLRLIGVLESALGKCQKSLQLSESYKNNVTETASLPESQESMCYMECVHNKMGWLWPNGDLRTDTLVKYINQVYGDHRAAALRIWRICLKKVTDMHLEDSCKKSEKTTECFFKENQIASPKWRVPSLSQLTIEYSLKAQSSN